MPFEIAGARFRRRCAAAALVLLLAGMLTGIPSSHVVRASQTESEAIAQKALRAFEYDESGISNEVALASNVEFTGSGATIAAVQAGTARAVSVSRGDVDGDGRDDLVVGYAIEEHGAVAIYLGVTSKVTVIDVDVAPELLAVGDFDGDGRREVAAARRASSHVVLGDTDDAGAFGFGRGFDVGGPISALAAGRLDLASGRDALAVATMAGDAAAVTVYDVSAEATALSSFALDEPAVSLAVVGLTGTAKTSLAIATEHGLSLASAQAAGVEVDHRIAELAGAVPPLRLLAPSTATDGATVVDAAGRNWRLAATADAATLVEVADAPAILGPETTAAVALRLNGDAIDDYAVITATTIEPTFYVSKVRATFTVTSNADAGPNTLRQAITNANSTAGADTITFNLPVASTSIALASPLPDITEAVTIDGTTQPGDDPVVELNGVGAGAGTHGLVITGGGSVVRGLVINRFSGDGIRITTAGTIVIAGNYIGTNVAGTIDLGNGGPGVHIINSGDNTIGGSVAADRNVISGNSGAGILIEGATATQNIVEGNYIGVTAFGTGALGNSASGVVIGTAATDNTIGGSAIGSINVISANGGSGITISATDANGNTIQGNRIGTNADNSGGLGNTGDGITIASSSNAIVNNRIAFNGDNGVEIVSGTGNLISTNSISNNLDLGIDLLPAGITPNDDNDTDIGPNNLQNFPTLTSASSVGTSTTISGNLESTPSSTFRIEFYTNDACDASGNGEGLTFVGFTTVTTSAAGVATFDATFGIPVGSVSFVTAIAIASNGDTSEFSACLTVATTADISVTKTSTPDPIPVGNQLTYNIVVSNAGPLPATNVQLFESTPSGTTFLSMATSQGTCTTPAVGGTGSIVCNIGTINAGASVTATFRVTVIGPVGLTITNTAFVSTDTPDTNTANNTVTESTAVIAPPDILSVKKLGEPFRIRIDGANFQPGIQVFIGSDTTPWPNVKQKDTTRITLKGGATLKAKFPKNVPVTIRVVNPDGGQDTFTFIR